MIDVSYWRVVLTDWWNCSATVTVTLRSGVQFTGKVDRHPAKMLGDCLDLVVNVRQINEKRHAIDLAEVVAITADAS